MSKILNDAYYTSTDIAEYCYKKVIDVIGIENITEIIESSAGNGVFLECIEKFTPKIPYKAYDIDPKDSRIIKQDFMSLDLEYKKGTLTGFNFPYGSRNNLSKSFANKGFEIGDYVCSILPISQLNNTHSIYKFDLIYSEDLKKQLYSGVKVHCCFNIYKRPINGLNKIQRFRDSEIIEIREVVKSNNPKRNRELGDFEYDLKILALGTATNNRKIGCILNDEDNYGHTFYIKIKNPIYKDVVINLFKNVEWQKVYSMTAIPALYQWMVYKYIKEKIDEIRD